MKPYIVKRSFPVRKLSLVELACGMALSTVTVSTSVIAAPQGGEIVAGQGSITTPSSTVTQVQQLSNSMVVDWQSFNVSANELVQFSQPSSTSSVLNQINDIAPSEIYGSIQANGLVYLINPNGILFGEGAHIQVGGLFASNLEIDPSRFMAGDYIFESLGMVDGAIVNRGVISASTGGVSLVSDTGVVNEGQILATVGSINLAVAKTATLDFTGDGLLQLTVSGDVLNNAQAVDDAISNTGEIIAEGGDVLISGQVARDVFTNVVNNSGVIKATRVVNEGGVIMLVGSAGNINNSGTLDVSGNEAGEVVVTAGSITHSGLIDASATNGNGGGVALQSSGDTLLQGQSVITAQAGNGVGGAVHVLGNRVGLFDQTSINASGTTGGGEILIGGDYQGKNADVQNASQTYVGVDTSISADALKKGDGGKVIIWADEYTQYYGDISVQGGRRSGNGGFVEVSGKNILNFAGTVDTTARNGLDGTLLLDPLDITINDAATGANDAVIGDSTILFGDPDGATSYTISETVLEALTGNVILQAQQDIILSDLTTDGVLNFSNLTTGESVVFQAGRNITFTNIANTIQTAGGNIHLEADSQHSAAGAADGTGALTLGLLTSNGGDITLLAAGANPDGDPDGFSFGGAISAGSGNVYISTSDNTVIDLDAHITQAGLDKITSTGSLFIGQAITAGTDGLGAGAVTEYASSITQDASITVGAASASVFNLISTGGYAGAGGAVTLTTNQALVINGDVDGNSVGDVDINGQITAGSYDIAITANEISGDNDSSSPPNEITTTGTLTLTANKIGITERPINIGSVTNLIINDIGTGDIEINLNGGTGVDIGVSSNALDLANLNSITDFTYNNTHSAVSLGTLAASGKNLTINAANGIIDNTSAVTAQNLTFISGAGIGASGIPINTVANLLTITSNGGDIYISDSLAGGSNLGLLTTVASSTEIVELTAAEGWNITQSNVNGAGGAGVGDTITLIATTGDIDRTAGQLIANNLTLNAAAGGIGIGGAIDASANTIALTTGGVNAAGNIFFATTGSFDVATFGGAVNTDASGQVIDLTADDWSVGADTTVGDANDSLVLRATTGGITDGTPGTGGNKLTAAAIAFSVTGLNDIDVTIDAGSVAALADNAGGATGLIQIDNVAATPGTLIVDIINGIAGITAVDNSITLNSTDASIDIQQGISSGTGAISLTTTEVTPGNYDISGVGVISTNGGTVTVNADGAININTVIDDSNGDGTGVSGTLNLTSGGSEAALANSGDITVVDTGVLSAINLSTLSTFNDGQTIDLTSGSGWNIASGLGSANDVITLTATNGDITHTAGTIVASDLTLEALGAAGGIGASGAAILTNTGALTLSSGGNSGIEGDIYVTDSSATVLKSVTTDASAHTIELAALSWNINDALAAGIGDTADTITITATGGAITHTAGTIAAAALTLDSFGAIGVIGTPLLTNAGLLTLTSGGDIYISDSFTGTSTLDVLTTANGTTQIVELTGANGWDITQSNVNGAGGIGVGDTISLIATTGNIDRTGGTLTANDLTLNAVAGGIGIGGGIGLRAPVDAVANSIALITGGADGAGDIYFATTGAFSVSAFSGNVTTAAGGLGQTIELAADSWDIDGASIGDANDKLVLTALTGGFSGVGTLSAAAVALNAVGAQDINVTIDAPTIAASSGGGVITINSIHTGSDLVVGSVGTVTGISTTDNNISLTSTDASIDIQQDISAGTGSVTLTTLESVPGIGLYNIGGVANVIASGGINIDSDNAINLNTTSGGGSISLINHDVGSVAVTDSGAIQLGTVSVGGGSFTINASGAITQSSALTIAGTSSFSAGANAITLDNASNDFTGAVSLSNSGANNVTITDINAIDLGTVTVGTGTFTVNASSITDSGTQTVGGDAVFNVADLGNITLDDAGNAYNAGVTFASAGVLSSVTFLDTTAYDVQAGGLTVDALNITAAGITQTGDLVVAGGSTFNAGANAITLTNATNNFSGAVSLNNSGANAVSVTDTNGIVLGASSAGNGGFTINATGNITQGGALTIAGASGFDAGTGVITLTNGSNDFGGAVSLASIAAAPATNSVTDVNAIDLGVINVAGALVVNAGTNITDSGTQTVGGTASFNVGIGGNITLNDAANAYASTVSFNSSGTLGNVTFVDTTALDLQASTIGGNLDVTGAGITQSGILNVTGTSSFTAGANAITLNLANNFIGAVSLSNSGANAVSITDANAIQLGTVNVGSGSFTVNANGAITQNSSLTIAGASSFSAGANLITLNNAANDFIGSVSLFNSGNNAVTITDANAIDLGTVTVGGVLNVNATGAITDSGVITVAGLTTLAAGAANDVVLNTASNNFNSIAVASANNVTLVDGLGGVGVAASSVTGNYNLTSLGNIASLGTLSAANANLLVTGLGNGIGSAVTPLAVDLTGSLTATANNGSGSIYISDAGNLEVASINASTGNVVLSAVGSITDTAGADTTVDIIANNLTIDSTAGAGVSAADALNLNVAVLTITNSTGDFFLTEANALTLRDVSVGSIDLFTGGNLTVRGNVTTSTGNLKLASAGTLSVFVGESFVTGAIYNPNVTNPALEAYICSVLSGCDQSYYSDRVTSVTPRTYNDGVTLDSSAGGDIVLVSNNINILINGEPNQYSSYQTVGNGLLPSGSLDWYVYEDIYPVAATLNAGANSVVFDTYTPATTLTVGTMLTATEIGRISAAGAVQFGTLANTGGVQLTTNVNTSAFTDTLLVTSGAVTTSAAANTLTVNNLSIDADKGIGSAATPLRVSSNTISAVNHTSGDIYLSFVGNTTLGGVGQTIDNQVAGGTIGVSATGNLIIANDFTVAGSGTVLLDANGTITRTGGTITANTVNLGTKGTTTAIGTSVAPVIVSSPNITANTKATAISNDIYLQNDQAVNLVMSAADHAVFVNTAGSINSVIGQAINATGNLTLRADDMEFITGSTVSGANINLYTQTAAAGFLLGDNTNAADQVELAEAELQALLSLGTVTIGETGVNMGDIILADADANSFSADLSGESFNLTLATQGSLDTGAAGNTLALGSGKTLSIDVSDVGATNTIETAVTNLSVVTNNGNVSLSNTGSLSALSVNTGSGLVDIQNTGNVLINSALTVGALALDTGGYIWIQPGGAINASAGDIALTVQSSSGLYLDNATSINASAGDLILVADRMMFDRTGASSLTGNNITISPFTANLDTVLGSTITGTADPYSTAIHLNAAELAMLNSTGTVTIGGGTYTAGVYDPIGINGYAGNVDMGRTTVDLSAENFNFTITTTGAIDDDNPVGLTTGNPLILNTGKLLTLNAGAGIGNSNAIAFTADNVSAVNTGSGSLRLAPTGNITLGGGANTIDQQVANGVLEVVSGGNIVIAGDVAVTGGGTSTVTLDAAGTITRTAGTVIGNTVNLSASAAGDSIGVSGTPVITDAAVLNANATGNVFVENISATAAQLAGNVANITFVQSGAGDLALGSLVASGTIDASTTSSNINGVAGQTVVGDIITVTSAGAIGASETLFVDATTSLSLTTNGTGAAGSISAGSNSTIPLSGLTANNGDATTIIGISAPSFTVNSNLGDGSGNLLLNATAGSIVLNADLNYIDLYLGATGGITQSAGVIIADQLLIRTNNSVVLSGNNDVNTLAANVATAGQSFTFNDIDDLSLGQIAGFTPLPTTSGITTNNGAINLTTGGILTQTALGVITGGVLTTNTVGGTALNTAANAVTGFNATDTTFDILLTDSGTLNVTGISTSGNITLVTGSLTQSGVINADQLTTSTTAGSNLNLVNTVNGYSATNTTSGNIVLNDNVGTLTLGSISQSGGGDTIITNTGGVIAQSAAISGALLNVTASGGINLGNTSNDLTGFSGTDLGGGNILIVDATALNVAGISTTGNVDLTANSLTDSGAISASQLTTNTDTGSVLDNIHTVDTYVATNTTSGNIVLNDNVGILTLGGISQSGGGDVTISNIGGTIVQSAAISGALLNVIASGGTTLDNTSNNLTSFNGTDLAGGNILVVDTGALDIAGVSTTGTVNLDADSLTDSGVISGSQLTTTTVNGSVLDNTHVVNSYTASNSSSGDIVLNDNVATLTLGSINQTGSGNVTISNTGNIIAGGTVTSNAVTLNATGGTITQSAAIVGTLLTTTSSGGTTLGNAGNNLTGFNATDYAGGNILIVDTGALDIAGVTTTGTVSLAADSLTDSGVISGSQLTTTTVNGSVLDSTHTVNTYVATNTTSGDIVLNDNVPTLTLGGISQSGGGDIIITNTGGAIVQSAAISGALLNVTASGGINLSTASNNLTGFNATDNAGGAILIVDTGALDIAGISTSGNANLTAGSLTNSGPILVGGTLSTSTTGGTTLNAGGNTIATYTGVDNAGGNILLTNTGPLSLNAVTTAGSISVTSSGNINQVTNLASTGGSDITVTSSNGSISMVNGSKSTTAGGNIVYQSAGDLTISLLDAAAGTPADVGTVAITSTTGSAYSADSINASLRANTVDITALNNIGLDNNSPFNLSSDIQGTVTLDYTGKAYIATSPNYINLTIVDLGSGFINSGAARNAGTQRSQSSGLEDVGFIDLALFSDINLFVIDGIGIALPADQSDVAPLYKKIPVEDEEEKKKKKKRGGLNVSYLLH